MPETEDLYEILHLHPSAHPDVVQAAYRRLALLYHPDKNPSPEATEMMAAVNRAYAVLSDPAQRAEYDRRRAAQGSTAASGAGTGTSAAGSSQASRSQSSAPRNPTGYFTLGSTKSEVADIHGSPRDVSIDEAIREEVWHYDSDDTIEFDLDTGKVQGWSNIWGNLRIRLVPGPYTTRYDFFTIGSHRDDVARLHGSPPLLVARQELDWEYWMYRGTTEVNVVEFSFSTGLVTDWENRDGSLKTRRSGSTPASSAGGPGAYTGRTSRTGRASNWRTIKGEGVTAIRTDDQDYPEYSLTVMLGESGITIFVDWGTRVSYSDMVSVNYWVDDGPVWQQSWVVNADGTSTFLPAPESNEMLQELLDSQTLTVMLDSTIASSEIAEFNIRGLRDAISPLLDERDTRRNSSPNSGYSNQSSTGTASHGRSSRTISTDHKSTSDWEVSRIEYNQQSRSRDVTISTADPVNSEYRLIVRFKDRKFEVFIMWDTPVSYSDKAIVRWQLDDGPLRTAYWKVAIRGNSTLLPDGQYGETIAKMFNSQYLDVWVTPDKAVTDLHAMFRLDGFLVAYRVVFDAMKDAGVV